MPSAPRADDIPELLHRLGLISTAEMVNEGVMVRDCSRRNRNFRVEIGRDAGRERGFLLKFARGADTARTLEAEAAAYRTIQNLAEYEAARRWVPRLHRWDRAEARLILELVPNAMSLQEVRRPPPTAFAAMGEALASLHEAGRRAPRHPSRQRPWAFSLHRPTVEMFAELSAANLRLTEIIQGSAPLCAGLDRLLGDWREDATIHGDVKWDNWVLDLGDDGAVRRLALVDWELACQGDATWDIGATFGEFFRQWIESVPLAGETPPADFDRLARAPLLAMRSAIRGFWKAYRRHRGWNRAAATWSLIKGVRMSAARLLQRTWERHQRASELSAHGVVSLQVASRLLQEPHLAAAGLLGLSLS